MNASWYVTVFYKDGEPESHLFVNIQTVCYFLRMYSVPELVNYQRKFHISKQPKGRIVE